MEKRKRWGPDVRQKAERRGRGKWRRSGREIKNVEPRPQTVVAGLGPTGRESM